MKRRWTSGAAAAIAVVIFLVCGVTTAGAGGYEGESLASSDLTQLSLEELMDIEVYSAAKKKQKMSDSAAAVYALTSDDIRRSGATSIPELLRMIPGVEVANINSNTWAITIRGFNDFFSNKLLVMIDGRSVYTPLFAGVYWDVQDTLIEDIDRIEVVRGPGGTLWGANAVNGVINIITKSAKDTQGPLLAGGGGTEDKGFGQVRYGVKLGEGVYGRFYAKGFNRDGFGNPPGGQADDAWYAWRGGFRIDWDPAESDHWTFQGDLYNGNNDSVLSRASFTAPGFVETIMDQTDIAGGNVLARYRHSYAGGSELELQTYYDRTERQDASVVEYRDTVDFAAQHRFRPLEGHEVVWGLGYRIYGDQIGGSFNFVFEPSRRNTDVVSGFAQDEISLLDDRLRLTLGAKLEHNSYTGFEFQPNGRFLLKVGGRGSLWGAVSRAVRTPSRAEDDVRINSQIQLIPAGAFGPGSPPVDTPAVLALFGNRNFDSEKLTAYELGYRSQPLDNLSFDVAAFFNEYDDLRTVAQRLGPGGSPIAWLETDPLPPHLVIPFDAGNMMSANTYGVEVVSDWWPIDGWRLRAGYTYFQMSTDLPATAPPNTLGPGADGASPKQQAFLRSFADLPHQLELDAGVRWVDELPSVGARGYGTADLRLGWKPREDIEISLVGQNLIDDKHIEFGPSEFFQISPTAVQRGFYGKVTWTP